MVIDSDPFSFRLTPSLRGCTFFPVNTFPIRLHLLSVAPVFLHRLSGVGLEICLKIEGRCKGSFEWGQSKIALGTFCTKVNFTLTPLGIKST